MAVVRCISGGHVSESLYLEVGTLWDDSDPLVKAHPDWFSSDLSPLVLRSTREPTYSPPVEAATAAPGEKRTVKRPPK